MKRDFFVFVTLLLSMFSVYAQIKPETFYMSTHIDYIANHKEFENNNYIGTGVQEEAFFQTSASMGMFFANNFLLGVAVPFNYQVNGESKTISIHDYMVATFGRYYFNIPSLQAFKLTLEAQVSFGNYSYEDSKLYGYKFGPGVSYFLHKKVSLDFSFLYGYQSMEPESDRFYLTGYKEIVKGFEPSLGVSIYL